MGGSPTVSLLECSSSLYPLTLKHKEEKTLSVTRVPSLGCLSPWATSTEPPTLLLGAAGPPPQPGSLCMWLLPELPLAPQDSFA